MGITDQNKEQDARRKKNVVNIIVAMAELNTDTSTLAIEVFIVFLNFVLYGADFDLSIFFVI